MNHADSNPRPKKMKNCFTSSLSVFVGLLLGLLASANLLHAVEDIPAPPKTGEATQTGDAVTPPPELPADAPRESDDSRNIPQPEVTIIQRKDRMIEEYRINGRVRYVKITPKVGKPYYLVDKDGDGELETRHTDLDGVPPVNEWILLEW